MFRLEKRYADEIIAHAREAAPLEECCGILGGKDGQVLKLWRTTNSEHSPFRYRVDDRELLKIYRELWANQWEMVGIYHSHIRTEAYPSPTDISLATQAEKLAEWPNVVYLLVSLQDPQRPQLRAFRIHDGKVTEEQLEIVE